MRSIATIQEKSILDSRALSPMCAGPARPKNPKTLESIMGEIN